MARSKANPSQPANFPWRSLEIIFDDAITLVRPLRIQPPPGKGNKRSRAKALRENVDRNLIPTTSTTNVKELEFWLEQARERADRIEQYLSKKEAPPDFIVEWGDFMYDCGMISSRFTIDQDDAGRKRAAHAAGEAKSKEKQRCWVARELVKRMKAGAKRHQAEAQLIKDIQEALDHSLPSGLDAEWLKALYRDKAKCLKSTYLPKRMPNKNLEILARQVSADLPPLPNSRTRKYGQLNC